ncbi:MAG: DUF5683 domain-containing protein [Bacteroidaceae bacterium]|nr:DUF5683 domain-containing protein [Bacteroidaceae bacterium]
MRKFLYIFILLLGAMSVSAADTLTVKRNAQQNVVDADASTAIVIDSIENDILIGDLIDNNIADGLQLKNTFIPSPKRAMWLGIVLPGAGQIYNHKYWKLPIIYGGMVGCVYAMRWNNMMYTDYSRAYLDLMDDDPQTQSYNSFMHLGAQITPSNKSRYETIFKRRKDFYRRYRDLSLFCMIGVYALSVIDAYVDASLSQFDISRDLSLRVEPAVINSKSSNNPLSSSGLGVNIGLTF